MRLATTAACFTALLSIGHQGFSQTGDGYVGVFGDAAGTVRCMQVPPQTAAMLYVLAKTAGRTSGGITGAEFQIEFADPSGYLLNYLPVSSAINIGDPLDGSGINISFKSCQLPDTTGAVPLGTIFVYNTGSGGQTAITVKRRNPPQNPNYQCALLVHCDPNFTASCNTAPPPDSTACLTQKAGTIRPNVLSADEFVTFLDGYESPLTYIGHEGFGIHDPLANYTGAECLIDAVNMTRVHEVRVWIGFDNGVPRAPKWLQVGYAKRSSEGLEGYYEFRTGNGSYSNPRYVAAPEPGLATYAVKKSGASTLIYTAGKAQLAPAWNEFAAGLGAFDEAFFGAEEWDPDDCAPGCNPGVKCRFVGATLYDYQETPELVDCNS